MAARRVRVASVAAVLLTAAAAVGPFACAGPVIGIDGPPLFLDGAPFSFDGFPFGESGPQRLIDGAIVTEGSGGSSGPDVSSSNRDGGNPSDGPLFDAGDLGTCA